MTPSDTLRRIKHKVLHSLALNCPKCGGEMANDGYPDESQIEEMPDEYDYYHAPSYWRCDHCIERRCKDCGELRCECSKYEIGAS